MSAAYFKGFLKIKFPPGRIYCIYDKESKIIPEYNESASKIVDFKADTIRIRG